jgi:hypothetical protein
MQGGLRAAKKTDRARTKACRPLTNGRIGSHPEELRSSRTSLLPSLKRTRMRTTCIGCSSGQTKPGLFYAYTPRTSPRTLSMSAPALGGGSFVKIEQAGHSAVTRIVRDGCCVSFPRMAQALGPASILEFRRSRLLQRPRYDPDVTADSCKKIRLLLPRLRPQNGSRYRSAR